MNNHLLPVCYLSRVAPDMKSIQNHFKWLTYMTLITFELEEFWAVAPRGCFGMCQRRSLPEHSKICAKPRACQFQFSMHPRSCRRSRHFWVCQSSPCLSFLGSLHVIALLTTRRKPESTKGKEDTKLNIFFSSWNVS